DILKVADAEGCMHEFVASGTPWKKEFGVRTLDIAKRMLDYGIHAPTIYFPMIVEEAFMVEPTETESRESLDYFVDVMRSIYREAQENPDLLRDAPFSTPVGRMDEAGAARDPDLSWLGPCNC
ncbi:MAG: glycine dehydrogenase subunit 2, partial [Candidatus Krumholzibacteriia bacterium]